ncbi:hypothetical protein J6590_027904 [Homalodisca vitripennis]|nr:hypothetical protein J6590_027904 [Homalodisca vitripennis]
MVIQCSQIKWTARSSYTSVKLSGERGVEGGLLSYQQWPVISERVRVVRCVKSTAGAHSAFRTLPTSYRKSSGYVLVDTQHCFPHLHSRQTSQPLFRWYALPFCAAPATATALIQASSTSRSPTVSHSLSRRARKSGAVKALQESC